MNKQEFHLLLRYMSPYRQSIALIIILAIFCAFFEAVNLGALVPLLQLINSPDDPGGALWGILKNFFAIIGIELTFTSLLVLMCFLFLIGQSLSYIRKYVQNTTKFQFNTDLMNRLFFYTLHTDVRYHHSKKGGTLIETINRESEQASSTIFILAELFSSTLLILVYFILLLYISAALTILCAAVAIASFTLLNFLILRSKEFGIFVVNVNANIHEFVHERINLLKLIKIFSTEHVEQDRFKALTTTYADSNCNYMMNGVKIETFFQIIIFFIAVITLYVSVIILNIPLASLLIFVFILIRLTDPLRSLNSQRHVLAGQLASLEKVDLILNELDHAKTIESGKTPFTGFKDSFTINDVSFSYSQNTPTLSNISLCVRKNEMVAIIGASGSGKSTLVDLLIRLMDPQSGEILVDGKNINEFSLESYHKKIGFVSQESYIFHDTILKNICYGSDEISLEKAITVAKIANAHTFITKLPEQYNTEVGEKGAKLSGGEKQRIALARALFKDPDILILDEATSALDSESEKVIQDSIASIKNKYTIIAIAHRLSTVENADNIIVIDKGKIVEQGTHMDLLQAHGTYYRYYNLQQRGQDELR